MIAAFKSEHCMNIFLNAFFILIFSNTYSGNGVTYVTFQVSNATIRLSKILSSHLDVVKYRPMTAIASGGLAANCVSISSELLFA